MNFYKCIFFQVFWIRFIKVGFINQYGLYIQNFISFGPKFIFLTKFICQWLIKVQDKNIGIQLLITKSIHTWTYHINNSHSSPRASTHGPATSTNNPSQLSKSKHQAPKYYFICSLECIQMFDAYKAQKVKISFACGIKRRL